MELYAILRRGGKATTEELNEAAARSSAEGERMPDEVRWIRSYVSAEQDGRSGRSASTGVEPGGDSASRGRASIPVDEIVKVADTVVVRPDPAAVAA